MLNNGTEIANQLSKPDFFCLQLDVFLISPPQSLRYKHGKDIFQLGERKSLIAIEKAVKPRKFGQNPPAIRLDCGKLNGIGQKQALESDRPNLKTLRIVELHKRGERARAFKIFTLKLALVFTVVMPVNKIDQTGTYNRGSAREASVTPR